MSCLKWSLDGRRLAVGDQDGYVSMWLTEKDLHTPTMEDFDLIENLMKNNTQSEKKE